MGEEGLIAFAVLIGAYTLLMPLIAFIVAKGAAGKIKRLQAEIELLKIVAEGRASQKTTPQAQKSTRKPKVAAKAIATPEKTKNPWMPPEQKAGKPDISHDTTATAVTPPQPKGPTFFDRMAANFMANWIIWLAAISLALGGLFIVQYGMERGYLGPVARVIIALAFGTVLMGVADNLRRKPGMGLQGWFTVPVALAAGGIASLYGGVVSAHVLYELTSPLVGFASMVLVSFLAVGAGLIYGPVLAVVGILGAYISPLLVAGGEGSPILYLYFLAVLTTALAVERHQKWIWLSAIAVGFSLLWGLILNDRIDAQPYLAIYSLAIIWLVTTLPAFGVWPKWQRTEMLDEETLGAVATHYPTILSVLTAVVATVLLSLFANTSLILWQTTLLTLLGLTAWAIFWCQRAQNLDQMSAVFAAGLLFTSTAGSPLGSYSFTGDPVPFLTFAGIIAALSATLFLIAAFWRSPRSVRPLYWVASGAIAPVATYFLTYANWTETNTINDRVWTFIAMLLTAFLAASALVMLRSRIRQRRTASDLFFCGALITTSFAAYLTVQTEYLAHVAALLSLAALALVIRFKYRWTGYLIWAFVAASTGLVVFDLFPDYSLREPVLLVIAVFGVVAGLLGVGYMMARDAKLQNRVVLYETAVLLTVALLVCALIARVASGGRWQLEYMVLGLYATVWIMMAGVQFRRMSAISDRLVQVRQYLGYGYGILGLGALGLSIIISPLFASNIKGIFPLDTVMAAYALPVLVGYALYHFKLLPDFITRKIALGFAALMAGFIAVMEIRRFWHGSNIRLYKGTEVGELYTYTVILLVATVITVVLALTRKNPFLRKIGLGLAALTAAKVFLWDTAGMQGLARATIVIALGLTLAGIGWLLQTQAIDKDQTPE
jgi:uncharacterized membrane protein